MKISNLFSMFSAGLLVFLCLLVTSCPTEPVTTDPDAGLTVTGIEIKSFPDKILYAPGEADTLDLTGLEVEIVYASGNKTLITNFTGIVFEYQNGDSFRANDTKLIVTFMGADYDVPLTDLGITVSKLTIDMSGVTFADKTVAYDGTANSITIGGTLPAGVTVSYEGNGKTEAGTYTVTAKFAVADTVNYNAIADMTATLTIEGASSGGCGGGGDALGLLGVFALAFVALKLKRK